MEQIKDIRMETIKNRKRVNHLLQNPKKSLVNKKELVK
jgi:hypothetical protein